jgi:hypothetical protein
VGGVPLKGTPAMLMRDRPDVVFEDEELADLHPKDGRTGLSPAPPSHTAQTPALHRNLR